MPRSETDGNPYVCDLYIQGRSYDVSVLGAGVPTKFWKRAITSKILPYKLKHNPYDLKWRTPLNFSLAPPLFISICQLSKSDTYT